MKILNLSQQDWANFAYVNAKCLRSVGIKCDAIARVAHPFYAEQGEVIPSIDTIIERISDYDVIQFFHDNTALFKALLPAMKGKKIIAYHTSSYYRKNFVEVNNAMNPHIEVAINDMPEFMSMGGKNALYIPSAIDTDAIVPPTAKPNFMFAHYPSNPKVKGTEKLIELVNQTNAKNNFNYSTEIVEHKKQLERMGNCEVYLEMFSLVDGYGEPYGDINVTTLEAAALGRVVITNSRHLDVYKKYYGSPFFIPANSENEFIRMVNYFYKHPELIKENQNVAREIVVKNHSYKASAEYLMKNVFRI